MRKGEKRLSLLSMLLGLAAFAANVNGFLIGHKADTLSFLVSAAFVICCFWTCIVNRSRTFSLVIAVYSGTVAAIAIATFVVGTFDLIADFLIPFALIVLPPYFGLTFLAGITTTSLIIALLTAVLFVVSLCIARHG